MTVVAIHQPNFFPWLGFFDKVRRADIFVLLDNVQMPLTGSSYTNRVSVLMNGKPGFIQLPVSRGMDARTTIKSAPIAPAMKSREKILRTLQQSYASARFAREILPLIEPMVLDSSTTLGAYNEKAIRTLSKLAGAEPDKIVLASNLTTRGSATELLISIVKAVGGDTYMAGGGAAGYQEDSLFSVAGVKLTYQRFKHPTYPQHKTKTFFSGLSIIDALMSLGVEGTKSLLQVTQGL